MPNARWVGAQSRQKTVTHAVWVTSSTKPYMFYSVDAVPLKQQRQKRLATDQIREGLSICGVYTPTVIAGENHGHDWDLVSDSDRCITSV